MKAITSRHVLETMEKFPLSYADDIYMLRGRISIGKETECYECEGAFIAVTGGETRIIVIDAKKFVFPDNVPDNENISMRVRGNFDVMIPTAYPVKKTYTDYGIMSPNSYDADAHVRHLTAADRDAFLLLDWEPQEYRPTPQVLFDVFVGRGVGKILAYFDGENIVGYLSYSMEIDDIRDVDHIYTVPAHRGRGIAGALAKAYSSVAETPAMWSSARNEASARTACSIGMDVVGKTYVLEKQTV